VDVSGGLIEGLERGAGDAAAKREQIGEVELPAGLERGETCQCQRDFSANGRPAFHDAGLDTSM
jgi:hypothetical protein